MDRYKQFRETFCKIVCIVILFFYLPATVLAWGVLGHRIVGEIASTYLTKEARLQIKQILGNETVAMAANWADFIKSDSSYKYLNAWHYIDFDSGVSYSEMKKILAADTAADAYAELNFLTKQLKNKNLSKDKKLMYLRLLIHIAGDIHQPFHSSEKGDNGGNGLKVYWFGASSNIHRVWDEQLIGLQELSYTEYTAAINFTTAAQRKVWQKEPLSGWLYESFTISQHLRQDLKPDQKLSYSYNFKNIKTVNEQLLKGGVRLAGLLNSIFSK